MAKDRACLQCKMIYNGDKCPMCNENTYSETYKGQLYIFDEKSEVAKNMEIKGKGKFAIRTK
mgnify:CR=1 FL=1|jgi:RNA polymerase subunit RPABC4/transcription elongation factor Spt4